MQGDSCPQPHSNGLEIGKAYHRDCQSYHRGLMSPILDQIHRLHGNPQIIISDRDKVFTSLFWKELMRLTGTTLHYSPLIILKQMVRLNDSTSV